MTEKCFICEEILEPSGIGVTVVRKKGIDSLLAASQARNDNKGSRVSHLSILKVHTSCRKNYTRADTIQAYLNRPVSYTHLLQHTLQDTK